MADSLAICSAMDYPEFADIAAKWLATQWPRYGLYVFWF